MKTSFIEVFKQSQMPFWVLWFSSGWQQRTTWLLYRPFAW